MDRLKNGIHEQKYYALLEWKDSNLRAFSIVYGEKSLNDLSPMELEMLWESIESGRLPINKHEEVYSSQAYERKYFKAKSRLGKQAGLATATNEPTVIYVSSDSDPDPGKEPPSLVKKPKYKMKHYVIAFINGLSK